MDKLADKKIYNLRMRVTYTDQVSVKARSFQQAQIKAEKYSEKRINSRKHKLNYHLVLLDEISFDVEEYDPSP